VLCTPVTITLAHECLDSHMVHAVIMLRQVPWVHCKILLLTLQQQA
jgi:hypothetical protein